MQSGLKQARIEAGLTVEAVAKKLNIRKKYIIALEENNIGALPSQVYINGYLKLYSKFLKMEPPIIVNNTETKITEISNQGQDKFRSYLIIISLLLLICAMIIYPIIAHH